jgi:hypothetical protein
LNFENTFTAELRKILTYKEELLTNVKNMLVIAIIWTAQKWAMEQDGLRR